MNDKRRVALTDAIFTIHAPHFDIYLTPKIGVLLRGDKVLAELGVVLNLGYHLVVNFHVKVRANVAGDEKLRR